MNTFLARALAILILLGVMCALPALSSERDVGTSQGQILKLGIGNPKALALGRAYTALAEGVESLNFNPAGLARSNSREFAIAMTDWIDDFKGHYLAYSHPHMRSNIGLSAAYFTLDGFDVRDANGLPIAGSDIFVRMGFVSGAFAWSLPAERIFLGSGLKMVFEDYAGLRSTSYAGDAGLLWQRDGPWEFGASLLNISVDAKKIPWSARAGAAYSFPEFVTLSADLIEDRDSKTRMGFGMSLELPEAAEVGFITLRTGYYAVDNQGESTMGILKSFNLHRTPGISFGLGVDTENSSLYNVSFDYSLVPLGALGTSHHLAVKFRF